MKSLRRGAGASYIAPAVAGSSPASDESRCSSIGRAMENTRAENSRRKEIRCGAGAPYFDTVERLDEGQGDAGRDNPPVARQ